MRLSSRLTVCKNASSRRLQRVSDCFLSSMAPVSDGTLVDVHPTQLFNDSGLGEQALIIIGQPDSLILTTKLRNAFSALAVNNLGHVDIRVTHVVRTISGLAPSRRMAEMRRAEASKMPFIVRIGSVRISAKAAYQHSPAK